MRGEADPGRRGPFWKISLEGKGAGVSGGVPLAEIRGSAPRTLPRALFARGIQQSDPVAQNALMLLLPGVRVPEAAPIS